MQGTHNIALANGRSIGPNVPPLIVAEMSGNHNGDITRAHRLIDAAKEAGVDAIKLQTYTADTMTIRHDSPEFKINGGLWDGYDLYSLYEWAHTPWEWHPELVEHCRKIGLTVFSTPFDESSVDFLEKLDLPIYKIASFEMTDHRLISRVAATGRPVVMSTGLSTLQEMAESVAVARAKGIRDLVLLHCVSAYPAPVEDINLRTIPNLAETMGVHAGLSDHTMGTAVSVAAIALGAVMIEKHMTLRRADGGPDAAFSLEPEEMKRLVEDTRAAWAALGSVCYEREASEDSNVVFRRSVYCVRDVPAGKVLEADDLSIIRPGYGLAPKHYEDLIGRKARNSISRGTAMQWSLVE